MPPTWLQTSQAHSNRIGFTFFLAADFVFAFGISGLFFTNLTYNIIINYLSILVNRKYTICVSGPGDRCSAEEYRLAVELGGEIASAGFVLVSGGRKVGVMDGVSKGAKKAGGLVVGVLPGDGDEEASEWLDVAVKTGMGSGRNNILVLTADVVIAIGKGAGTISEIALAIKAAKPVILFHPDKSMPAFFQNMDGDAQLQVADSVPDAVRLAIQLLKQKKNLQ